MISGFIAPPSRERLLLFTALALPLVVSLVLIPFRTTLPSSVSVLLLTTVIVGVAAYGDRDAGFTASVSAALWYDFFLTRPYERLAITGREDVQTAVLLLIVGGVVTELAARGRHHRMVADLEADYLLAIRTTADLVAAGTSSNAVCAHVCTQLSTLLDLKACRFERGRFGGLPSLDSDGTVRWVDNVIDVERLGMPEQPVELRASSSGNAFGRFVLEFDKGAEPSVLLRQIASILANQAAASIAREGRATRAR